MLITYIMLYSSIISMNKAVFIQCVANEIYLMLKNCTIIFWIWKLDSVQMSKKNLTFFIDEIQIFLLTKLLILLFLFLVLRQRELKKKKYFVKLTRGQSGNSSCKQSILSCTKLGIFSENIQVRQSDSSYFSYKVFKVQTFYGSTTRVPSSAGLRWRPPLTVLTLGNLLIVIE